MNKVKMSVLTVVSLILCLTGCQNSADEIRQAKQEGELTVVTSFYPMYDFAHPIEDAVEHITFGE